MLNDLAMLMMMIMMTVMMVMESEIIYILEQVSSFAKLEKVLPIFQDYCRG